MGPSPMKRAPWSGWPNTWSAGSRLDGLSLFLLLLGSLFRCRFLQTAIDFCVALLHAFPTSVAIVCRRSRLRGHWERRFCRRGRLGFGLGGGSLWRVLLGYSN